MSRILPLVFCTLLFLLAGVLRLTNVNWDQFQHVHPDERFIVWVADTISWPDAGAGSPLVRALDPAQSTLNPFRWPPDHGELAGQPRSYAYGHFPLYLLVVVAHAGQAVGEWFGETSLAFPAALQPLHTVGRRLADYNYLAPVGRVISAACDLATLLLIFAFARRLYGPLAATLAAGAYAFAVLPIQLSHFYAVDLILTLSVVASVLLAARWAEGAPRTAWLGAGAMSGLAVGSKFSAVLLAAPLLVAALHRLPTQEARQQRRLVVKRLAEAGGAGLLVFVLTNPFAILEIEAYAGNILTQNAMVSGLMDAPFTRQYIGTIPYWYFIQQLSQWGLGWPLGIVAWGGLVWATVRVLGGKARPAETVVLAWALPYFALTGIFHAKFLRYMAPLVPFLLLYGAGAWLALYRRLRVWWGNRGQLAWIAATALIGLVTMGWGLAFTGVYRQEHPWLQASRWIYANIPAGSTLLSEHWDDALPLAMDEVPGVARREYRRIELPLYEPDTPEKLERLVSDLSSADYLVLASNRLSRPIGRLTQRYPMSSQYYRLLFSGQLGYQEVAGFSAYPRLGDMVIPDDNADESFTVYDHPRPRVFANVERLSPAQLRARLGRYLPEQPQSTTGHAPGRPPGHAALYPPGQAPAPDAPLTLPVPVDTLPAVSDFRWNDLAVRFPILGILLWWLALGLFGWLAWPLLFPVLGSLHDRGYGLARVAGWLLVGWVHWLGVSFGFWQNRTLLIAAVLAVLALAGLAAWYRQRRAFAAFAAGRRRLLLAEEGLFLVAFLGFVGIRLLNPDLWQPWNGGEKFMEFAFLNATLRSPHFPPYDPYFAGGIVNYYYFGLYLVGLVIKLTGIPPEIAFNLAIPGLFALTATAVFSVGCSLARPQHGRIRVGLLAVALALLMGNLDGFLELGRRAAEAGGPLSLLGGRPLLAYDFWAPSRVIPYTINEFPFWSFLFADLHPHLIAMPLGMLAIGLALAWVLPPSGGASRGAATDATNPMGAVREPSPPAGASRGAATDTTNFVGAVREPPPSVSAIARAGFAHDVIHILWLVLSLGALGATNTWDLPVYGLAMAATFLVAAWRRCRGLAPLVEALMLAAATVTLAVAAYWPFYTHYRAQVGGGEGFLLGRFFAPVQNPSPLGSWLLVWGVFFFLALVFTLVEIRRLAVRQAEHSARTAHADARTDEMANGPAAVERPYETANWPDGSEVVPLRVRSWAVVLILALGALAALLAVLERPTAALVVVPLGCSLVLLFRREAPAQDAFLCLLLALGLGVLLGTELFYLRDFLEGGEWQRMNTVFKFSMPAWLFLGLAGAVILRRSWIAAAARPGVVPVVYRTLLVVLLVAGFTFLPLGTLSRVRDRFPGPRPGIGTLDGMAYMAAGRYHWPDPDHTIDLSGEYRAINWLLDNVTGTPVIAEAPAGEYVVDGESVAFDYYRAGGLRVSSFTGLPTFAGQHQYEQRPSGQVRERTLAGQTFFQTTDIAEARRLMLELRVGYIYIGALERLLFAEESLRKFDVLAEASELDVVYSDAQVKIYRTPLAGSASRAG